MSKPSGLTPSKQLTPAKKTSQTAASPTASGSVDTGNKSKPKMVYKTLEATLSIQKAGDKSGYKKRCVRALYAMATATN